MTIVENIYRYPVKGLTGEALSEAPLEPGRGIVDDRRFAIAPGSTYLNGTQGAWMAKSFFLTLARNPKLAQLQTSYDDQTQTLTILRRGKQVSRGKLTDPVGRTMIEDFFTAFMKDEARGRPKVFEASPDQILSDQSQPLISLINLASVRDLARVTGTEIAPIRFRGNIYFESDTPWQETDWVGKTLTLGDLNVEVIAPVGRCVATHVNPETAEADVNILKALQSAFGHTNCGVFAKVTNTATLHVGDKISL